MSDNYVHNSYITASMGNDIAVLELERDPLPRRSVQISDSSDFNELTKDSPMTVIGLVIVKKSMVRNPILQPYYTKYRSPLFHSRNVKQKAVIRTLKTITLN